MSHTFSLPRLSKRVSIVLLFVFFALFFAQKIHLPTADLGRHITNGRILCEDRTIIRTNFYSYTESDYPVVTHHWATGVIFYFLWKLFSFNGLSLFYILIHLITLSLFFTVARGKSTISIAFFCTAIALPLLADRIDIRPEGLSYLFLGVYFFTLYHVKKRIFPPTVLYVLPILQMVWVNCHVYFPMGLFLIGVFFTGALIHKEKILHYFFVLSFSILGCFINPFGLRGFLTPFTIFKEYGYMVAENQSLLFMQARFGKPVYVHFEFLCIAVLILILLIIIQKRMRRLSSDIFILIVFGILAWRMTRGIALFGYFFIPIAAHLFHVLLLHRRSSLKRFLSITLWVIPLILIGGGLVKPGHFYSPFYGRTGLGLMPGVERSARFFIQNTLAGPVFNNYDIGSYLIFYLFPQIRPFVDNRPEAYSVSFFKETYIPMQKDESEWQALNKKIGFNAIYFYRRDITPWAQPFLIKRLHDPDWVPVFVDHDALILLKRNKENASLIKQYELPKEMFRVRKT